MFIKTRKNGPNKSEFFGDQTPEEFVSWVEKQVIKHPVVKQHHGKWRELIEWRNGNQYSKYSDTEGDIIPADLKTRKLKIVINVMKPLVETIEGKLDLTHNIIGVANSSEATDIFGAQVSTKFIDHNNYINDIEELQEELKEDLLNTGQACRKWMWDREASGFTKGKEKKAVKIDGELVGEVIPIFNVRPDPVAKTPQKMRWLIELKEITVEEAKKVFKLTNAEAEKLKGDDAKKYEGMYEKEEEKDKDEDTVVIWEFWEKTNDRHDKGRYIVSCRDAVLYFGENPAPNHELPYFFFYYDKSKYSFWAKGPLHYIQDIQRWYNRMVSLEAEHIEAWRPKMAIPPNAMKNRASFTVDNFELIEVDQTKGTLTPVNMPPLGTETPAFRDFLRASVDMVSNVHEVSYARLPQYASRAPASLYQMMLEQENIKLGPMVRFFNKELVRETKLRLLWMDKKYTLPRMVRTIGENRKATIDWYSRAEVNGNYDIRLEQGVSINKSTSIQTRLMLELWKEGVLEKRDRFKILSVLDLGTAEHELRSDVVDVERAVRENQFFSTGEGHKPEIFLHDDHETHLDYHTNLQKTEEYESWDEKQKLDLVNHIAGHFKLFLELQQMAMGGGAVATPGEGTGPGAAPTAGPADVSAAGAGRPPESETASQPGAPVPMQ